MFFPEELRITWEGEERLQRKRRRGGGGTTHRRPSKSNNNTEGKRGEEEEEEKGQISLFRPRRRDKGRREEIDGTPFTVEERGEVRPRYLLSSPLLRRG